MRHAFTFKGRSWHNKLPSSTWLRRSEKEQEVVATQAPTATTNDKTRTCVATRCMTQCLEGDPDGASAVDVRILMEIAAFIAQVVEPE
eukprot:m.435471 g.435471  ORF g.435471 m.435471 type:complete len:88 (-) comp20259_c0_seq22:33-296(-)